MTRWHVMLSIHVALAGAVLGWSLWGAYTFWAATMGSPWAALGLIALIEAGALAGYALHILGSDSPVALARHALPIVSVAPSAKSLHDLAVAQVGDGWAWAVALVLAGVLAGAAWAVWSDAPNDRVPPDGGTRQGNSRGFGRGGGVRSFGRTVIIADGGHHVNSDLHASGSRSRRRIGHVAGGTLSCHSASRVRVCAGGSNGR